MKYDCLLIGHNDTNIKDLYTQLKAMGENHADFRDLDINVVNFGDDIFTVMDAINNFRYDKLNPEFVLFHNGDLLWNVILYLGSYLHKENLSFDYVNLFQREKEKLRNKLKDNNYEIIAITTTVYTMVEPVIEIIEFIKSIADNIKIVVGGPLINKQTGVMTYEEKQLFYKFIGADIYIDDREGEKTLVDVIKAVKFRNSFNNIPNIIYISEEKYIINQTSTENNELDKNLIDYSLFNPNDFNGAMNIRISKGCPYNCSFCGFPKRSNSYKYFDVSTIISELGTINGLNVSNLFFMDDSVNVPKSHFKDLLKEMVQKKYNFTWNCFFRCDQCDEEMIDLMQQANCEGVFLGLESADDNILKNMNKSSRKEHFEKTIPVFHKNDINVFVSIFTGFPGETFETFRKTIEFIEYLKADFYRPQLWYCDPITPICERRNEFGLVGSNFSWKHNTMSVSEACDLNEWAFFYLNEPVWTPDPGFNFISIYYMKKKGYTILEIKDLLISFNNVVKLKLMGIKKPTLLKTAISNLTNAINRENEKIDRMFMDDFSGTSYQRTEKYIQNEFELNEVYYTTMSVSEKSYKKIIRKNLNVKTNSKDIYSCLCAKATMILSAISRKEFLNVICHDNNKFIPLRINCKNDVEKQIYKKMIDAYKYGIFGLHIFSHNKQYIHNHLSCDLLISQIDWADEYNEGVYNFDLSIIYNQSDNQICVKYLANKVAPIFAEYFLDLLINLTFKGDAGPNISKKLEQLKKADILNNDQEFCF